MKRKHLKDYRAMEKRLAVLLFFIVIMWTVTSSISMVNAESKKCPFLSVQARVQIDKEFPWEKEILIDVGQSLRIGALINGSKVLAKCCVTIEVIGPNGFFKEPDNGKFVTFPYAGKYILIVTCKNLKDYAFIDCGQPDLKPAPITYNSSDLVEDRKVLFDSGVINSGDKDSGPFNIRWFVDGKDVGAYGSHENVPANSTIMDGNSQFTWKAKAGTHTITFAVDTDNQVKERYEDNNQNVITVNLFPDLIPTPILHYPKKICVSDKVLFETGVKNIGNAHSGEFKIRWLMNGHNMGVDGIHGGINAISSAMNGNSSYTWKAKKGTYTITYIVDTGNNIAELNENNNKTGITFTVKTRGEIEPPGGKPDLIPHIEYSPSSPVHGDMVTFSVWATNRNKSKVGRQFKVKAMRINPNKAIGSKYISLSQVGQFSWWATEGTHRIRYEVDVNNDINEANENNNQMAIDISVACQPLSCESYLQRQEQGLPIPVSDGCDKVGIEANWVIDNSGNSIINYDKIIESNTKWVRVNFRRVPGQNNNWYEAYDPIINTLVGMGFRVYGLIGSEVTGGHEAEYFKEYPGANESIARQWIDIYANIFAEIADYFNGRVEVFESYNEPNNHHEGVAIVHPYWFAEMLKAIDERRNSSWSNVHIVSGPILIVDNFNPEYVNLIKSHLQSTDFPVDGYGFHIYINDSSINRNTYSLNLRINSIINGISNTFSSTDKKIYISEFGWPATYEGSTAINCTYDPYFTFENQAAALITTFNVIKSRSRVALGVWFSLFDTTEGCFGLYNGDGSPKTLTLCAFQLSAQACQN